jgi:hypothetical protein
MNRNICVPFYFFQIEKMSREVSLVDPFSCTFSKEMDAITMETLLLRHLSTKMAQDTMRTLIRVTFGKHISSHHHVLLVVFLLCSMISHLREGQR